MRLCLAVALSLAAGSLRAADDLSVLETTGKDSPRTFLKSYLLAECQKHFDARRAEVGKLRSTADIQKRQRLLRARFIEALGGFPDKTPLRPRIVGSLKGAGFRVEKVIYESRPGHHVTANFYRPDGKGPFPGVLMPIGHSANGKAADYIQRGAILLARNGIAVLAYDPIGQGERIQLLDNGKPALRGSTTEHTMAGVGALLVGWSTASYRVWDAVRSLDYLTSRDDVDPTRIGCTGCSGGGTVTSYLMALDDRVAAAAPSCYITSLERLFNTIGPQDAEQNIPGQVAFGMEHADYIGLRLPRPTLICAATHDFFDIAGTWASFREAKRLYTIAGFPERVDLVESDSKHGFPQRQREAVLRFMRRWLLGKDDAPTETKVALFKDEELRCTRTGQVLEDLKGVSVFGLTARRAEELARARAKRAEAPKLDDIARLIGVRLPVAAAKRGPARQIDRKDYTARKVLFTTEPGVVVPALLFAGRPVAGKEMVVYVHGEGKAADAGPGGPIEKLVEAGHRVLALDLRGLGELAPTGAAWGRPFGPDVREAFLAMHLGRPLLGQRVTDLLAVLEATAREAGDSFHLVGVGRAGPIVLHAAALDRRVKRVTLERSVLSWTAVATTALTQDQLSNVVPGALAVYDLPELAGLIAPRPLTIRAATDAAGKPVPRDELRRAYAATTTAYARAKVSDRLTLEGPGR